MVAESRPAGELLRAFRFCVRFSYAFHDSEVQFPSVAAGNLSFARSKGWFIEGRGVDSPLALCVEILRHNCMLCLLHLHFMFNWGLSRFKAFMS